MLKSILIAALIVGAYMSSILNETENNTLLSERKKIFSRIKSSFCRKKRSAPILYYSNHSARFQLLISGDVETNPGPTTCGICERTVRKNSHQMNILNASSKLTVNVSPLSIVKFHCFQFGFLENYVCNKQKKSIKDQRNFSFDAILKVFANLVTVHSEI